MATNSFKVKNSLVLTPRNLSTITNPEAGDLACDINDNNKLKRYDTTTSSWVELGSSEGAAVSTTINTFNGDNSTTAFTLSIDPLSKDNTQVYVDGVYQNKATYSVTGTSLQFSEAPPTGTGNIEVEMLSLSAVGSLPDATSSVKGVLKLAGDLGGTADLPTVPALSAKANLASPALTGTPTAPTAPSGTNTTQVATTEFVQSALSSVGSSGLLRMTVFTASGTWTKQADVSQIIVELVGGGGGGSSFGSSGGTSSFGAHCSATGGTRGGSAVATAGLGGSGSGGNINAKGNDGMWGVGGDSFLGKGSVSNRNVAPPNSGCGGGTGQASPTVWGGGAGGYSKKLITAQSLGATETVTIGAGGNGNGADFRGGSGLVIIYEYGG